MKLFGTLLSLLLAFSALDAKPFNDVTQVVEAADLDCDTLKEILLGNHPEIAIQFDEGTEIPMTFLASFDLVSFFLDPNFKMKIEKTYYFRAMGKKCYLSTDLVNWKKPDSFFRTHQMDMKLTKQDSKVRLETKSKQPLCSDEDFD